MHERHASFVGGLLSRKISQAASCSDPGKFVFGVNQGGGPRYGAGHGESPIQGLPVMRYGTSGDVGASRNGENTALGELSFAPPGGTHNDRVTGNAGLSVQAKSAPPHILAPEDRRGSALAEVAAMSKAGDNPVTVERTGQGHIARKAGLSAYSQTANASISNAQIDDPFSGSNVKGYHGLERTGTPLSVSMDAAAAASGPVTSRALPDVVSSRLPVQRSLSFSYSLKPQSHPRSPLTLSLGTSGIIARQLQNNGSDRTASRLLESYQASLSRPASPEIIRRRGRNRAVSETESGFESALPENLANGRQGEPVFSGSIWGIPSGSTRSRQMTAHYGDGRVLHRLPVSSPTIATRHGTLSIQSPLEPTSMHPVGGASRLSGPGLQPLNSDSRRPPEREPVGDGLPVIRSAPLQRLSGLYTSETLRNLPDTPGAPGVHISPHQYDNVQILREPITRSAGSVAMGRDAAATGGTDTILSPLSPLSPTDRPSARTELDPAINIPLRLAPIPQAQPVVRRPPGDESLWARWDPWNSSGAARRGNMPSSIRELSRPAPLHLTETIRPSRMVSQSPREPITSRIHGSLYQANRYDPRQHGYLPVLRKTIAPSTGNAGLSGFSATSDTATAVPGPDHSTTSIARFSNSAESHSLPRDAGPSGAVLMHAPTITGETRASDVLAGIATPAAATFGAMPSATPSIRRLAAGRLAPGIAAAQTLAQRRIQNNARAIFPAPLALPHAAYRQAITGTGSGGHEGTSSSHASIILATNTGIAENQQSVGAYQETRGVYRGWTPGAAGRPLVMARRTRDQLMRATGETAGISAYSPSSATSEDRYGVVPVSREGVREAHGAPGGETSGIAAPALGEPDPDEIAEQAWRIMTERLVIEQERRGLAKWP